jgi:hypothetical protein
MLVEKMSFTIGIALALGAMTLLLIAFGRRSRTRDLGAVSRTWIIENRADHHDRG